MNEVSFLFPLFNNKVCNNNETVYNSKSSYNKIVELNASNEIKHEITRNKRIHTHVSVRELTNVVMYYMQTLQRQQTSPAL